MDKLDMIYDQGTETKNILTKILEEGCPLGKSNQVRINKLEKNPSSKDSSDSVGYGKWKFIGIPAIIFAMFLGFAVYQKMISNRTEDIAQEVKSVKEKQDMVLAKAMQEMPKLIVEEVKKALKP